MEYATLIMMIVTFLQEKKSNNDRSLQGLKDYLLEKNFQDIVDHLESNQKIQTGIETLLNSEFDELNGKIDFLTNTLSSVAAKIDGFGQIIPDDDDLSEQAVTILKAIASSESSKILYFNERNKVVLFPPRGSRVSFGSGALEIAEPRFLHDDIDTLVTLNWLTVSGYNESGTPFLTLTRKGAKAAQQI